MLTLSGLTGMAFTIASFAMKRMPPLRMLALTADTHGEPYEMTGEALVQLDYQNPKLGFYRTRLVAGRLLKDLERQRQQPAAG